MQRQEHLDLITTTVIAAVRKAHRQSGIRLDGQLYRNLDQMLTTALLNMESAAPLNIAPDGPAYGPASAQEALAIIVQRISLWHQALGVELSDQQTKAIESGLTRDLIGNRGHFSILASLPAPAFWLRYNVVCKPDLYSKAA